MKRTLTALALAGMLAGASVAEAAATKYRGKASGGYEVTLKRSGGSISALRTGVPTVCMPTTRGYSSRSGVDLFTPPGRFRIGRTVKAQKLQKTAMWHRKVTKYYTVKTRRRGNRISGNLQLSFSYALPVFDYYGARLVIYICRGNAKFSAAPR